MILVGNQRGGASDLSAHLLKPENERIEVHELRGFVAEDLHGALQESYAVSRTTKCRQHLFSLSLSPPPDAAADNAVFHDAIDRVEESLGLTGQPRAIVFHEKNGRRHAHAVWSRIDTEAGKAIQLSFTHNKLQEISRDIYLERGWRMPSGFIDKEFTDPRNFTLAEWQQAKRAEKNPQKLKGMFQDAYAISDSRVSFQNALNERGFWLARGDRRGFVAVDHSGEAYSLSRWIGVKPAQLKARLGAPDDLPSVEEAQLSAVRTITTRLDDIRKDVEARAEAELAKVARIREEQARRQAEETARLEREQEERKKREAAERNARLRRGVLGFLDRLTGRRRRITAENEKMAKTAAVRDASERAALGERHSAMLTKIALRETEISVRRDKITDEVLQDVVALKDREAAARPRSQREVSARSPSEDRPKRRSRPRDGPSRT